ncbi:FKBP-type peptidyl-prolyl cis-trans isomerase [Gilvimarinus sp. F26214L]|uniref:FKBP-type peptidyl-prolyl cis-trans isomerase n=1 Tax=Gilvimarinus sp. DZF01 TaxID=3461371 RepID=UPI004046085D
MSEEVIGKDKVVAFHYRMYRQEDDGTRGELLESSHEREPVSYLHGHRNIIPGLEAAMTGKALGEEFKVGLAPEQAYGVRQPNSVQRVPVKHLHLPGKNAKVRAGDVVAVQTERGPRHVVVVKAGKFTVDVDTNHPLAGIALDYEIKIESIRDASAEEIAHGHVHGPGGHHH